MFWYVFWFVYQVEYVPEALENATECFVEMLDLEKIVREKDQVVDDGIEDEADEDEDDICELQTSREENNKEWLLSFRVLFNFLMF